MRYISSPPLFRHFAVWVTVWVKPDFVGFTMNFPPKDIYIFREKSAGLNPKTQTFS